MDLQKDIEEGLNYLKELNARMKEISEKIGALQEEGKALHGKALEVKGGVESLARLQEREKKAAEEAKAKLILPEKTLVAADGKTPIAHDAAAGERSIDTPAPAAEVPASAAPAPTTLEVVK